MRQNYAHVNDEDLLLYAGGELEETAERVEVHLAGCQLCRSRMEEVQKELTEFSMVYGHDMSEAAPAGDGRAALKAGMADVSARRAGKRSTLNSARDPTCC
jgi:anti-sigma factor RsiW